MPFIGLHSVARFLSTGALSAGEITGSNNLNLDIKYQESYFRAIENTRNQNYLVVQYEKEKITHFL